MALAKILQNCRDLRLNDNVKSEVWAMASVEAWLEIILHLSKPEMRTGNIFNKGLRLRLGIAKGTAELQHSHEECLRRRPAASQSSLGVKIIALSSPSFLVMDSASMLHLPWTKVLPNVFNVIEFSGHFYKSMNVIEVDSWNTEFQFRML